jgi:hypothetical protein
MYDGSSSSGDGTVAATVVPAVAAGADGWCVIVETTSPLRVCEREGVVTHYISPKKIVNKINKEKKGKKNLLKASIYDGSSSSGDGGVIVVMVS